MHLVLQDDILYESPTSTCLVLDCEPPSPSPTLALKSGLMRKQIRHGLAIMRPPTGLGQGGANINRLEPGTALLLLLMRHRIRDHDPAQLAPVQRLDGLAAEDAVRDEGHHLARPVRHDRVGRLHQRPARVRHVVHQDRDPVLHVAHQHHPADFVRPRPLFVDQREAEVEPVGDRRRSVDTHIPLVQSTVLAIV